MGGFFDTDSIFSRAANMVADAVILSCLWLVFSLPVVTAGASAAALFYVATKRVANREGYLFRDFLKSFKENFIQATVVWLVLCTLAALMVINIWIVNRSGGLIGVTLPIYLFVLFELGFMTVYIFPVISRFQMGYKELIKTVFFMANRHLLTTIACLALLLAIIFAVIIVPVLIFAGTGAYALLASYIIIRVIRKYRPEIDADDANE